jgi:hypothetical protein
MRQDAVPSLFPPPIEGERGAAAWTQELRPTQSPASGRWTRPRPHDGEVSVARAPDYPVLGLGSGLPRPWARSSRFNRRELSHPRTLPSSLVGGAHFQLVTTDGDVLGARELGRPDWPPGSVIYAGPGEPNLRVVDVMPADDAEQQFTVLAVESV